MPYTSIDHTADIGINVYGADSKELFTDAAIALFDHIVDSATLTGVLQEDLDIIGIDWPDLMVNWLRELLYLWNGKQILIKSIDIQTILKKHISAKITGDRYNPKEHTIIGEIKAVTYHQIHVARSRLGWEAKIIFDV